jgi:hypothetical protein
MQSEDVGGEPEILRTPFVHRSRIIALGNNIPLAGVAAGSDFLPSPVFFPGASGVDSPLNYRHGVVGKIWL